LINEYIPLRGRVACGKEQEDFSNGKNIFDHTEFQIYILVVPPNRLKKTENPNEKLLLPSNNV
jgi:hypothetical protein